MKRWKLPLLLLTVIVNILAMPACILEPKQDKRPTQDVEKPTEPPDRPPPPPPDPPPSSGTFLSSSAKTLESIAWDVLRGRYGQELQQLMADEVSACINLMSSTGMVSIQAGRGEVTLKRLESESTTVTYSDWYLIEWILSGRYGQEARSNLHRFIRSFEGEKRVP